MLVDEDVNDDPLSVPPVPAVTCFSANSEFESKFEISCSRLARSQVNAFNSFDMKASISPLIWSVRSFNDLERRL